MRFKEYYLTELIGSLDLIRHPIEDKIRDVSRAIDQHKNAVMRRQAEKEHLNQQKKMMKQSGMEDEQIQQAQEQRQNPLLAQKQIFEKRIADLKARHVTAKDEAKAAIGVQIQRAQQMHQQIKAREAEMKEQMKQKEDQVKAFQKAEQDRLKKKQQAIAKGVATRARNKLKRQNVEIKNKAIMQKAKENLPQPYKPVV